MASAIPINSNKSNDKQTNLPSYAVAYKRNVGRTPNAALKYCHAIARVYLNRDMGFNFRSDVFETQPTKQNCTIGQLRLIAHGIKKTSMIVYLDMRAEGILNLYVCIFVHVHSLLR